MSGRPGAISRWSLFNRGEVPPLSVRPVPPQPHRAAAAGRNRLAPGSSLMHDLSPTLARPLAAASLPALLLLAALPVQAQVAAPAQPQGQEQSRERAPAEGQAQPTAPEEAPATPPAQPQPQPQPQPQSSQPGAPPAEGEALPLAGREMVGKGEMLRILGQDVKGVSGIVVGQLVNVLVTPEGQPRAAVLDYGGFLGVGRRRIAVAWSTLRFTEKGIQFTLSRDQLRGFPDFRDGEDVAIATAPPPATPGGAAPPGNAPTGATPSQDAAPPAAPPAATPPPQTSPAEPGGRPG